MTQLKDKVNTLNQLIISGDTVKAMEMFYSENIEMQENEETPRKGKNKCIEIEVENLKKVQNVESILINQAIDEEKNVVFSEWKFIYTNNDNNIFSLTEVSVQQWLNGQIVKEKFYYKNFYKVENHI
ncbi:MAG: hypothetical protein RLZZ175_2974 [Bacteroidota bacterium]|jgi:hypothetical protein